MYNVYSLYEWTAGSFPERPSVIYNGEVYTFGAMRARINKLAKGLYDAGVRPHSTLGVLMYNGVDFLTTFYAAQKLGCVLVMLNWRLTMENQVDHINISGCDTLIYEAPMAEGIGSVKSRLDKVSLYISRGPGETARFEELLASGDPNWTFTPDILPSDPALCLLTGGTSSRSKVAVATQENMMMRTLLPRLYSTLDYTPRDNFLTFSPMFHQGGVGIFLPVSVAGGCITMMDRLDVEPILQAVEKYKVTRMLFLPPTLCQRIKENPELQKYDLSSVDQIMLSGGASSGALAEQVFETFPNPKIRISISYGATENAAETMHYFTREQYYANKDLALSIGKRSPFTYIKLLDENGKEVPDGVPGECYGKAYGMFSGYMGRPDPFVDGWFPTGDYLSRDENGYYYFRDRKNFMIKSGGENVIPLEVEAALNLNEKVAKCAVFGLPDKHLGEKVAAAVVLKPGCQLTEEELIQFAKEHIASYKKPKSVFFMDDLLYTTVGKVDKRALQKLCGELDCKQ